MLPNALLFLYHVQHVTPSSKAFLSVYALRVGPIASFAPLSVSVCNERDG